MPVARPLLATVVAAALLLTAACDRIGTHVQNANGSVVAPFAGNQIVFKPNNAPEARMDAQGHLSIDGKEVALTPAQRQLVLDFHREYSQLGKDGMAIGAQGAAIAGKAITAAIKDGLSSGHGSSTEATVEAETRKIQAQALKLCDRLATIRTLQQSLAQSLPQFQPYAVLAVGDVEDCRKQ